MRTHTSEIETNARDRAQHTSNSAQSNAIRSAESTGAVNANSNRPKRTSNGGDWDTAQLSAANNVQREQDSIQRGSARSSVFKRASEYSTEPTTPTTTICAPQNGAHIQFGNGLVTPPAAAQEKKFDIAFADQNENNNDSSKDSNRKRSVTVRPRNRLWKSFRIVSLVILAFLASNLPWHFVENLRVTRMLDIKGTSTLYIFTWMLTYSNALLNPIIYFFMNSQYRTAAVHFLVCRSMRSESRRLQQRRMTDYYLQRRRPSNNPTLLEFQSQHSQRTTDGEYCRGGLLRVPTTSTFSDFDESDPVQDQFPGPGPGSRSPAGAAIPRPGSGRRTGAGMRPPPPGFYGPRSCSSYNTTSANGNGLDANIITTTTTAFTSPTSSPNEASEFAAPSSRLPKISSLKGSRRISAGLGKPADPFISPNADKTPAVRKVSEVQVLIVVEEPSSMSRTSVDTPHNLQDLPIPETLI